MNHARTALIATLAALAALALAGSATAARPAAPQTVAVDVTDVASWGGAAPGYVGSYNVTFHMSPSDAPPESPTYREYVAGLAPSVVAPLPTALAGWVYYESNLNVDNANAVVTINVTWDDGSGLEGESVGSCEVTVDLRVLGDHDQCTLEGAFPDPPAGASGIIVETLSETQGRADLRWRVSPDDPDQEQGDFTYVLRFRHEDYPEDTWSETEDGTDGSDADGVRYYADEYSGGASFTARYDAYAKDPRTRLWSQASCFIELDQDVIHYQDSCGNMTVPDVTLNPNGPQFPLVNITQASEDLGFSLTVTGLAFAGGTIATGTLLGLAVGGPVGAGVGGTMAFAVAASLNLVPLWAVVLVFMACVAVAVTFWTRGGGGQ